MGAEKRRFTRFRYQMPVELDVEGRTYRINEVADLGMGGCLLPQRIDAEPGTSCTFRINLGFESEGPAVNIEGEVLRHHDNETAIKFTKIDPESLVHLQRIALYNSPDPGVVEEELRKHPGIK